MAVTANPSAARGFVSGRASLGALKGPYVRIRRQRLTKPADPTVAIEKLDNLTIDAIAHRDETDRRIVQQLSGRALLDRNLLPRWPADGGREPVAGGCVFAQAVRPAKP